MVAGRTRVEADGLGDWRFYAATRVAADVPPAYPGGPSHKAGSAIVLVTSVSIPNHPSLSFMTPSATALALDAAFNSGITAAALWPQINFKAVVTPDGPGTAIATNDAPLLFDFLSASMVAAVSSFQAIEAFANETIARHLKGKITLQRRKGPEDMDAEEIERHVSTEEKIATVLPLVLNMPSIKGGTHWQKFVLLKRTRDAATHFKSGDQYSLAGKISKDSLYSILLINDPCQFPLGALRVIWSLRKPIVTPRWLDHLAEKHGLF